MKTFFKRLFSFFFLLLSFVSCTKEDCSSNSIFGNKSIVSVRIGSYENWHTSFCNSRGSNENLDNKVKWEVGDSLLVRYEFYSDVECKMNSDIFYTTYMINNVDNNGIPSLILNNKVLYKQSFSNSDFNEIELESNGIPWPLNAIKVKAYMYYAPHQKLAEIKADSVFQSVITCEPSDNGQFERSVSYILGENNKGLDYNEEMTFDVMSKDCSRLHIKASAYDNIIVKRDFYPVGSVNKLGSNTFSRPDYKQEPHDIRITANENGEAYVYGSWNKNSYLCVYIQKDDEEKLVFKKKMEQSSELGKTYYINTFNQ